MSEGFIFDRLSVDVMNIHTVIGLQKDEEGNTIGREFVATVRLKTKKLPPLECEQIIKSVAPNDKGLLLSIPEEAKPIAFDTEFEDHRVNFRRSTKKVAVMEPCTVHSFTVERVGDEGFVWQFLVKARVSKAALHGLHDEWLNGNTAIEIVKGDLPLNDGEEENTEERQPELA